MSKESVISPVPIVAADNQEFRDKLAQELAAAGVTPVLIGNSTMAWKAPPKLIDEGLLVLETDDDVARLVQIVNNLTRSPRHIDGATSTICVVSQDAAARNRSLDFRLVDGHAAVMHVSLRETMPFHCCPVHKEPYQVRGADPYIEVCTADL